MINSSKGWRSVAVIGASEAAISEMAVAEEVGGLLAARGIAVVCGGLGGVMEAVCRGARNGGGTTIGILPGRDHREANPFVDIPISTGLGEARNIIVVTAATHGVIAIGGEFGTLSEIGFALKLGKMVVGIQTWQLHKLDNLDRTILVVETAEEAVGLVTD